MSIWRNDPTTGELVAQSNPLQFLLVIISVAVIAAAVILKVNMHALLTPVVLDRAMLVLSVLAMAFALLHLRKGKGGIIAFSALIAAGFAALASAYLSWNGHDWIINNQGNGVRLTAFVFSLVAVFFLRIAGLEAVEKHLR